MADRKYDYLIVGAGLFGAVCARELTEAGKRCLVIDRRGHIGGNCYSENLDGIQVHRYGAHIFHTSDAEVWKYVNQFTEFNHFINSPVANYHGKLYNLPFNMNTFYQIWGVVTPDEARTKIREQVEKSGITNPKNLEEQAISLVGRDIYEILIKGYTEKQWGRPCRELPADIIKRLPVRFRFDNNYFNDIYQGIPVNGYTAMIEKILNNIEIKLNLDYLAQKEDFSAIADYIIYTGPIDEYFNYQYGPLEWRGLRFETEILEQENYQGVAAMNYTDAETPFTRIIEHKHFVFDNAVSAKSKTVITREYPSQWKPGDEPYYPINNQKNQDLLAQYQELAAREKNILFGGRLGAYQYYDMDKVIRAALNTVKKILD